MTKNVYIQTKDGVIFHIDEKILIHSKIINDILKLRSDNNEIVPLFNVSSSLFTVLIQWMTMHTDHKHMYPDYDLGQRDTQRQLHPYDIEFCSSLTKDELFEMLKISTQLGIDMLVEITAKTITSKLNSMTTEEMRNYLEEENDLEEDDIIEIDKRFSL